MNDDDSYGRNDDGQEEVAWPSASNNWRQQQQDDQDTEEVAWPSQNGASARRQKRQSSHKRSKSAFQQRYDEFGAISDDEDDDGQDDIGWMSR